MIALSTVQSSTQTFIHITSNDRPFGCPIICTDIIHNTIMFIDTSNNA